MSKAEILAELPTLTFEDRREILRKILELQGDQWLDDGELTEEEKSLIEQRLADHVQNPAGAVPWEEVKERLAESLGDELGGGDSTAACGGDGDFGGVGARGDESRTRDEGRRRGRGVRGG